MPTIKFEHLYATEIKDGGLEIIAVDGNQNGYTFSVAPRMVDALILALQSAKMAFPVSQATISMGARPIITPDGLAGFELILSDHLHIPILLPPSGLEGLRACIDQLPRQPAPTRPQ